MFRKHDRQFFSPCEGNNSSSTTLNIRERHYTLIEVATHYNITYWCAREMFKDYLGVRKIGREKPGKRTYYIYRIPESVLKRKDEEMTNGGAP